MWGAKKNAKYGRSVELASQAQTWLKRRIYHQWIFFWFAGILHLPRFWWMMKMMHLVKLVGIGYFSCRAHLIQAFACIVLGFFIIHAACILFDKFESAQGRNTGWPRAIQRKHTHTHLQSHKTDANGKIGSERHRRYYVIRPDESEAEGNDSGMHYGPSNTSRANVSFLISFPSWHIKQTLNLKHSLSLFLSLCVSHVSLSHTHISVVRNLLASTRSVCVSMHLVLILCVSLCVCDSVYSAADG